MVHSAHTHHVISLTEYKQIRKVWRKAKKEKDAASCPADTLIPPPGALDLYSISAPPLSSSDSNPTFLSPYLDDDRFYKYNAVRRGGPVYEKPQSEYPRTHWSSPEDNRSEPRIMSAYSDDRQHPEFQRGYADSSSYVGDWSKTQWSRHQPADSNTFPHNEGLTIDTAVSYSQQDRSPTSPLTPPSGSPEYLQDPTTSFGTDATSTGLSEYPSHTPSPPYSTPDSTDSYHYASYHEPQPQWASASPARTPYQIQASNALVSSSYPPPSHQHGAMSPSALSSYSAPSPTYAQHSFSSAGVTSRNIPSQFPSWRGQDDQ